MKIAELFESKDENKFVIIGNPGNHRASALYPSAEAPKLYTEAQAKKICDELNDRPKITQVHWHYKSLQDLEVHADRYISGSLARSGIRSLMKHEGYKILPSIDTERYGPIPGLEGPYRHSKTGEILYYDPKEGKYYNRDSDMYVDYSLDELPKSKR